jgi:hypothetical protein
MLKLRIAGSSDDTRILDFKLEQDGSEIDVMANDDLIATFVLNVNGKVVLELYPVDQFDREMFEVDETGRITIRKQR